MIHIGDISREKRLNHPSDALKVGERIKAQVLEIDRERRRFKLGIKQLEPTSIDEYLAERKTGETVTGRILEVSEAVSGSRIKVELGQGVIAFAKAPERAAEAPSGRAADLSAMTAMLSRKWKSGGSTAASEPPRAGQVREFKIASLDREAKRIELELQS
jgi:small subunit ribosomal protein S1